MERRNDKRICFKGVAVDGGLVFCIASNFEEVYFKIISFEKNVLQIETKDSAELEKLIEQSEFSGLKIVYKVVDINTTLRQSINFLGLDSRYREDELFAKDFYFVGINEGLCFSSIVDSKSVVMITKLKEGKAIIKCTEKNGIKKMCYPYSNLYGMNVQVDVGGSL